MATASGLSRQRAHAKASGRWRTALALAWLGLAACSEPPALAMLQSPAFGASASINLVDANTAIEPANQLLADWERWEQELNPWTASPLARVNADLSTSGSASLPPSLMPLLLLAQKAWLNSGGLVDAGTLELSRLWGFDQIQPPSAPPPPALLERYRQKSPSIAHIRMEQLLLRSTEAKLGLDLTDVGVSHALDQGRRQLAAAGVQQALLNLGGHSAALGNHGERPWHVSVADARSATDDNLLATIKLFAGESLANVNNHLRAFEWQGLRYHAHLHPLSAYPARGLMAVSVIAEAGEDSAFRAITAAKALLLAGPHWQDMAAKLKLNSVLVIDERRQVFATGAMQQRLQEPVRGLQLVQPR